MVYPDYRPVDDAAVRALLRGALGHAARSRARADGRRDRRTRSTAGRSRGCTSWARTPRCPTPTSQHAREALRQARAPGRAGDLPDRDGLFRRRDPAGDGLPREDRDVHEHRPPRAARPPGARSRRARPGPTGRSSRRSRGGWGSTGTTHTRATSSPRCARRCRRCNGITWDRLEREGAVTYPCDAEDQPGHEVIFGDGFPTPTGRGKLVPADVLPPDEMPDDDLPDDPDDRPAARALAHRRHDPARERARRDRARGGRPPLAPRPEAPGRRPRRASSASRTRRGTIELAARADRDVPPGLIFIPFCYAEAAANLLTNPALDPFGKIPEFKFCAARVERGGDGGALQQGGYRR